MGSPYCFAHLDAGSHSSLAVRSRILPKSGMGFGPGGGERGENLGFLISQRKRVRRKQAPTARRGEEEDMGQTGGGRGGTARAGMGERGKWVVNGRETL